MSAPEKVAPCSHNRERIEERILQAVREIMEDEGFDEEFNDTPLDEEVNMMVASFEFGVTCADCSSEQSGDEEGTEGEL